MWWRVGSYVRLVLLMLVPTLSQAGEPYTPQSDDQVLELIPAPLSGERRELRLAQQALAQRADALALALEVARRAIRLGRSEADPRYFGYAEAALSPWWSEPDAPNEVLLLRATLLQQRHDFSAALRDLDLLLQRDPAQTQARLTRAVIAQVQARYPQARADCAALIVRDFFAGSVCMAGVQGLTGRGEAALRLLDALLERADVPQDERVWSATLGAEISARLGQEDAGRRFASAQATALRLGAPDPYLLVAQADELLDRGQARSVCQALQAFTRMDAALLRLAMAEKVLALPEAEAHIELLRQRFEAAMQRGDPVHRREQAMFELHLQAHPQAALRLAQQNWQVQREPADARILLQSALAAGQPQAAAEVLDWMQRSGIEDRRLQALAAQLASPRSGA